VTLDYSEELKKEAANPAEYEKTYLPEAALGGNPPSITLGKERFMYPPPTPIKGYN